MKKFLSLVLALVMTMSLVTISAGAKDFTDADKVTYTEAVDVLSAVKVIDGYTDGAFKPTTQLNRGQAAKILCNMILGPTTASALKADAAPFKDVAADNTFAGYIAYCSQAGIIDGYTDGTFRPSAPLTGYAFMKLLLGALGYDKDVEGYNAPNWSINVAKQALAIGLDKGLTDDFDGTKIVTREEACLYALNTLKADLVEYEAKTSISVGGAEVVIAGSKAQAVTSTKDSNTIKDETAGAPSANTPDVVQFAEKYFPKLSLTGDTDAFMRPANLWKLKGVKVGAYTKTPDLTYTKKTKSDTIYDDLGLSETIIATTYEDGANKGTFTVKNGDTDAKIGKQGVLTEVFKTETASQVYLTITKVNTYVGDVTAKVAATKTKDAYVSIAPRLEGSKGGNFDTTEFALDDVVLYTYSFKDGSEGVKSVATAEIVPGTLTGFTIGDSATVGGTKYDYAAKVANEAGQADINTEVKVVLDAYGNAIDIDGAKDANYAVVLDSSTTGTLRKEAILLFTDGTVKTVSTTDHYLSVGGKVGDIVSYVIKTGDKYQLTTKATVDNSSGNVAITNNAYGFTASGMAPTSYTANGKTIFLVKTVDANGDAMYKAYEGIKNVPTITSGSTDMTVYCKLAGNLATIVYVDASAGSVLDPSSDVIFVKGTDDVSYTSGVGSYYKYSTVLVNGEKPEDDLKATTHVAKDTYAMFDGVSYDANGVATMLVSNNVIVGTGVYKQANEVLGTNNVDKFGTTTTDGASAGNGATVNAYAYYPVAKDLKVAFIDEDGDLTTGYTINSVAKDSNDVIFFKLNTSNEITYAVILKVKGNVEIADLYNVTLTGPNGFAYTVKQDGMDDVTGTDSDSNGKEIISLTKGTYTVELTVGGITVTKTLSVTSDGANSVAYGTQYTVTLSDIATGGTNQNLSVYDKNFNVVFDKDNASATETLQLIDGEYYAVYSADNCESVVKEFTVDGGIAAVAMDGSNYTKLTFNGMKKDAVIELETDDEYVLDYEVPADGNVDLYVQAAAAPGTDYHYVVTGNGVVNGEDDVTVVSGTPASVTTVKFYTVTLTPTAVSGGKVKVVAASTTSLVAADSVVFTVEAKIDGEWVVLNTSTAIAGDTATSTGYTTTSTLPVAIPYQVRATAVVTLAGGVVLNAVPVTQVVTPIA